MTHVVPGLVVEDIVAGAAEHHIVSAIRMSLSVDEHVIAVYPEHAVVAEAAAQLIGAVPAADQIVA